ncbi:MAG: sodium:pantothenate symporter [Acidobacteria bacterium]|nr:sodium:pantothenate symporter [Acidobacteriota bacterium]|tara:strand:- start:1466 stop:2938 length:1473 start_codon:yes stop_codon:yes gene_type:complete
MITGSLGRDAVIAVSLYLAAILAIGYAARRKRSVETLAEFYLAGRQLNGPVLLLTLYATQYSGNTLVGYPGEAYRLGFSWVMSVGFMMAIIVAYLLFAPRLHHLAQQYQFITPGDWLTHRFGSPALTLSANVLLLAAVSNYLLAQLIAMGHITAGLSGGTVPYWVGVVLLTLVVLIYETVGGMRAVAWTDSIQGLMLVMGLGGLLVAVVPTVSELTEVTTIVAAKFPAKVEVPTWDTCRNWFSTLVLIGISGSVYPHAIQRIFAASNASALKKSFSVMVFLPLVTTGVVFLIGVISIAQFSETGPIEPEEVLPILLTEWSGNSPVLYGLSLLVIVAVASAIMSTADSVLLSLSSILAKDVLATTILQGATETHLTRVGKALSWILVAGLVVVALNPRLTLWGLTELKMEILAQVAPLFVLGTNWNKLNSRAALSGIVTGTAAYASLLATGYPQPWNIHAGVLALGVNLAVCYIVNQVASSHTIVQRPDLG